MLKMIMKQHRNLLQYLNVISEIKASSKSSSMLNVKNEIQCEKTKNSLIKTVTFYTET